VQVPGTRAFVLGRKRENILEREIFRLKLSFSHKKDTLLDRIRDKNNALYAFLDRASHIASASSLQSPERRKGSNSDKLAQPVLAFQRHGAVLYQSLQLKWSCPCPKGHPFAVALRHSESRRSGTSSLWFELLVTDIKMRVKITPEVKLQRPAAVPHTLEPTPAPNDVVSQQEAVSELRATLTLRNHLQRLKWKGSNAIQALVLSTSSQKGWAESETKDPTSVQPTTNNTRSMLSVPTFLRHSRQTSSSSSTASPPASAGV